MLAELFIDNFIIIKRNHIIFEDGFNVLTGETGSGKSLILEAINLLLGKKASKDVVGKFSDKATIEGIFILDEKNKKILEDNTIIFDEDDNKLIVNRTIGKKSSTLRINGRIVNLASLREIAPILVDIYKQGDSNAFMNKANYIYLIDSYSNDKETINLKKTIKSLVSKRNEFLEKFDHLNLSDEEISRERDLIEYQISEIDQVDLSNINEEEIDEEYRKLTSINEIREAIENSKSILDSSEYDTISATEMINKSMTELSAITDLDDKLSVFYDRLSSLNDEIGDIYSEMDLYEENLIGDSYRQQELEDLMEIIFKLKRKYGRSIEDILDFYGNISKRLEELNEIDDLKNNLDKIISEIDSKLEKNALILHEIRNNKSKIIEEKINKSIRELNIKNGLFKIKISQKNRIDINGLDDVDFLIRTNKGEDLKSLQDTASGGEISRIMLAFKEIFADFDDVDTMIFDEIDTGISGRTAQIVGEKILDLSKNRQVISISHLPQIAALANNHLLISKKDEENFTISSTKKIENKDRVEEIARLIGGVNITKTTIDSASEILTMAQELTNERR